MGRGEREDSAVIGIPCKYSHTTLGGLQSDFICGGFFVCFLCQHQHGEVCRTVYLRHWRAVRAVHWSLDLNRII